MAGRPRRLVVAGIATLIALAVLVSLGNWQLRRLHWKEALIARLSENMARDPVALPPIQEWDVDGFLDAYDYRPVRLTGRFLDREPFFAFTIVSDANGALDGPGYWVMSPFALQAGGVVYVNRGFVPDGRRGEVPDPPDGMGTVFGVLRAPEAGSWLTPDANTSSRVWHVRDVAAMATADALAGEAGPVAPFFIDLDAAFTPGDGLPQAGETRARFPNNHLQYALTWYGLALALAGVFAAYAWRELSPRRA